MSKYNYEQKAERSHASIRKYKRENIEINNKSSKNVRIFCKVLLKNFTGRY